MSVEADKAAMRRIREGIEFKILGAERKHKGSKKGAREMKKQPSPAVGWLEEASTCALPLAREGRACGAC